MLICELFFPYFKGVFMLKLFSNEVIDFRTNTAFASELTNIFQECIEKRESIQDIKTRVKEVPSFFVKTSVPKLNAAIKKYTGITCDKIVVSKSLNLGYACLMTFGDTNGIRAWDVVQRYSGQTSDMNRQMLSWYNVKPITAAEMDRVAESLDRETGLFSVTKVSEKINCTMTMYFDPYASFLMKEAGHANYEYMLAPEITAVVLHEIGHMISTMAHAADRCFRIQAYNRCLEYFTQNATVQEKAKFLKSVAKDLPDKTLNEKAIKAIDECTAVDAHSPQGSWILNAFSIFINALIVLLSIATLPVVAFSKTLEGFLGEMFDVRNTKFGPDGKLSDMGPSNKGMRVCEQFADEYVAKHGMSNYQISALRKIFEVASHNMIDARAGAIAYAASKIPFLVSILHFGDPTDGGGLYDGQYNRGVHIMNETLKAFKSSNMDSDMVAFFIEDYERCKKELTNRPLQVKYQNAMKMFYDAWRYLAGTLPAMLFTGRFNREYEILINKIETLTANSLFYRAAKLDQLTNKK
jgi:hypothetical protein